MRDRHPVHLDALAVVHQVWRSVEPCAIARGPQAACGQRTDRSLPLRARDVNNSIAVLRIAQLHHQCAHAIEIEIGLRELRRMFETIIHKRIEIVQRPVVGSFSIRHGMDCKAEVLDSKSAPKCWER